MSATMRAAYIDGHGSFASLKVGTRPKPVPGPGDVLVKVAASSLNRVDLYMIKDGS